VNVQNLPIPSEFPMSHGWPQAESMGVQAPPSSAPPPSPAAEFELDELQPMAATTAASDTDPITRRRRRRMAALSPGQPMAARTFDVSSAPDRALGHWGGTTTLLMGATFIPAGYA